MKTSTKAGGAKGASQKPKKSWKLGDIAVYNGLVEQVQLEECLALQKDMAGRGFPMTLGKIFIEKYYVDRISLQALIRAQAEFAGATLAPDEMQVEVVKFTPKEHDLLVERVRAKKLLEPEQIDECFDIQCALEEHGIDKLLGEICLEKGYLSREAVADILEHQQAIKTRLFQKVEIVPEGEAALDSLGESDLLVAIEGKVDSAAIAASRKLRFGRLVLEKELAGAEAVRDALFVQFRLKELGIIKRIGEILVEKKHLRTPDVRRILQLQKQRLGAIRWSELTKTQNLSASDRRVAEVLLENAILSHDEIDECRFVQKAMRDLGFERTLGQVIVEKEYLDREVIAGVEKELKKKEAIESERTRREAGPTQVGAHSLKSAALENAYREILARMKGEDEEVAEEDAARTGAGSGVVVLKTEGKVSARAVESRTAPGRPMFWASAFVAVIVLAAGGVLFWYETRDLERFVPQEREHHPKPPLDPPGAPAGSLVEAKPDGGPAPSAASLEPGREEELRASVEGALAGLDVPEGARKLIERAEAESTAVEVDLYRAPGAVGGVFLLVAGRTRYPVGTRVSVEVAVWAGSQAATLFEARAVARETSDGLARIETSFGPYAEALSLQDEPGAAWLPAGEYSVRLSLRPADDDEAWRTAVLAAGLPDSGVLARSAPFPFPGRSGVAAVRTAQEAEVRKVLGGLFREDRELARQVVALVDRFRGGAERLEVVTRRLEEAAAALDRSTERLDRLAGACVYVPCGPLHSQVVRYHAQVRERVHEAASIRDREAPEAAEFEVHARQLGDLERSLSMQLPAE